MLVSTGFKKDAAEPAAVEAVEAGDTARIVDRLCGGIDAAGFADFFTDSAADALLCVDDDFDH